MGFRGAAPHRGGSGLWLGEDGARAGERVVRPQAELAAAMTPRRVVRTPNSARVSDGSEVGMTQPIAAIPGPIGIAT